MTHIFRVFPVSPGKWLDRALTYI